MTTYGSPPPGPPADRNPPGRRPARPASPAGRHRAARPADRFRALGLLPGPDLTDDDVRAAWHRIAAATHPDRADGGDPAAFAAAAAAYTDLRTPFGRSEALADLASQSRRLGLGWRALLSPLQARLPPRSGRPRRAGPATHGRRRPAPIWPASIGPAPIWTARVRAGRPARLALLIAGAATVGVLAVTADGWQPPSVALIAGALIWVVRGGRRYLGARAPAAPEPDATAGQPGEHDGAQSA
jgi:hypothetical protein